MCSLKEAAASAVAKEPTSQGKKSAAAAKKEAAAQAKAKALAEKEAAKIANTAAKKAAAEVFFAARKKMSKFQLKSFYHKSAKQRIQLRICRQRDQSPPPPHQLGQCHRNALRRSTTTS